MNWCKQHIIFHELEKFMQRKNSLWHLFMRLKHGKTELHAKCFHTKSFQWERDVKLPVPYFERINALTKILLSAFWVSWFITPTFACYFFLFYELSPQHQKKKKNTCLGKKHSQLHSDGWNWDGAYFLFKELEILCSVNGGKDLRRNRKIKFAWKSPRLLDSFSIK